MKKQGILNAALAGNIAALGKTDIFMIGNASMPIPAGIPVVDLALTRGIPSLEQVLTSILTETEVEFYFVAEELEEKQPDMMKMIEGKLPDLDHEVTPYINLRQLSKSVKFAVRTGEVTPYATIVLRAGEC